MSILDKLKEGQPPERDRQPDGPAQGSATPAPRWRVPVAVSEAREIARIGETIVVRGDVRGAESLVIDCTVEGAVTLTGHDLTIGRTGRVSAGVSARLVRIEGEVNGDIVGTDKVVITETGRVLGNIVAPRVSLEDGARFKGAIDMNPHPTGG